VERFERAGARRVTNHVYESACLFLVEAPVSAGGLHGFVVCAEHAEIALKLALVLVLLQSPWVVRRPHLPRKHTADDESCRPLRMRGSKENRHRRTLGETVEGRAARADSVEHSSHVVHARLQRRCAGDRVGHARSTLVEPNQPREGREPVDELSKTGELPIELDMTHERWHPHEIEGTLAGDLIREVNVSALRVPRAASVHGESVRACHRFCNVRHL
jgi:hypothetical protein